MRNIFQYRDLQGSRGILRNIKGSKGIKRDQMGSNGIIKYQKGLKGRDTGTDFRQARPVILMNCNCN